MKTRFLIIVLVFAVLTPQAFAQTRRKNNDTGAIRFGILAGGGLQTLYGTDYWGEKLDNKLNPGFHTGGIVNIPLFADLWIQSGVMFSLKGARQNIINENITKTINLVYAEIPVNVLYRPQLGDGHLLIGAGPYAGYGLLGNERTKIGTITTELKVKFIADASNEPSSYVYYKGLDAGANIFLGYELYSGIFLQVNGQMGFLKVNSEYGLPNDQTSKMNFGLGLSAGYRF